MTISVKYNTTGCVFVHLLHWIWHCVTLALPQSHKVNTQNRTGDWSSHDPVAKRHSPKAAFRAASESGTGDGRTLLEVREIIFREISDTWVFYCISQRKKSMFTLFFLIISHIRYTVNVEEVAKTMKNKAEKEEEDGWICKGGSGWTPLTAAFEQEPVWTQGGLRSLWRLCDCCVKVLRSREVSGSSGGKDCNSLQLYQWQRIPS